MKKILFTAATVALLAGFAFASPKSKPLSIKKQGIFSSGGTIL